MSKEYIEKNKLIEDIECIDISDCTDIDDIFTEVERTIDDQPAADVVEVVRCGECDFWDSNHISCEGRAKCLTGESGIRHRGRMDFFSYGKRKDGADNGN